MDQKIEFAVGVPHDVYEDMLEDLRQGKKAYTRDINGHDEEVELRESAIYEKASGRIVMDLSTVARDGGEVSTVTTWGKLMLEFGAPVAEVGPLKLFRSANGKKLTFYDAATDEVIPLKRAETH